MLYKNQKGTGFLISYCSLSSIKQIFYRLHVEEGMFAFKILIITIL